MSEWEVASSARLLGKERVGMGMEMGLGLVDGGELGWELRDRCAVEDVRAEVGSWDSLLVLALVFGRSSLLPSCCCCGGCAPLGSVFSSISTSPGAVASASCALSSPP